MNACQSEACISLSMMIISSLIANRNWLGSPDLNIRDVQGARSSPQVISQGVRWLRRAGVRRVRGTHPHAHALHGYFERRDGRARHAERALDCAYLRCRNKHRRRRRVSDVYGEWSRSNLTSEDGQEPEPPAARAKYAQTGGLHGAVIDVTATTRPWGPSVDADATVPATSDRASRRQQASRPNVSPRACRR
jgi:hypothetical protein